MITEVRLKNFKSFVDTRIPLAPLTVLTGMNASGKSSLIQAVRMIKQSYNAGDNHPALYDHVMLSQLKSKLTIDKQYAISFIKDEKEYATAITAMSTSEYVFSTKKNNDKDTLKNISYISANRWGPKNQLPVGNPNEIVDVGNFGEYVISFIDKFQYTKVPQKLRIAESTENLLDNINDWLEIISRDMKLSYKKELTQNLYFPFYNGIVPTETGVGLSFVLPVLAALLYVDKENKNCTIMIENPESHLHPAAQTRIGELIALSVACGKQVIIETHSDHIIDGIRIAARQQKIRADLVSFCFFIKNSFEEATRIEMPRLHQSGKLSFWPEGFFDQGLKNMEMLLD